MIAEARYPGLADPVTPRGGHRSVGPARVNSRADVFGDTAEVHDPGFGRGIRNYTGFGAAVEAPAPFGTLIAVEWGFGVQGVDTAGRRSAGGARRCSTCERLGLGSLSTPCQRPISMSS